MSLPLLALACNGVSGCYWLLSSRRLVAASVDRRARRDDAVCAAAYGAVGGVAACHGAGLAALQRVVEPACPLAAPRLRASAALLGLNCVWSAVGRVLA